MSTALALGLIAAGLLVSLATSAWSIVLHLTRRQDVTPAELHAQVTQLRLEVSELVDKFTASQKRQAVRAMRERQESGGPDVDGNVNDPAELKRKLRARVFGGTP